MSLRSVLVDGGPIARIGEAVTAIEPDDDGRHAWILASWKTYQPMWRVYCWALDDGALLDLEAGPGDGAGLAVRARRVFIRGSSREIRWLDLESGAGGVVPIDHGHDFYDCSRDGRYLATQNRDVEREVPAHIHRVDGAGEPFPEVPAPVVFSDDDRFAVHFTEDGGSLRWISLAERTTRSLALGATASRWRGLCPVRGAARVVAWDETQLVVADLVTASVVARVPVEALASVEDAAVERVVVTHHASTRGRARTELLELPGGRRIAAPDAYPRLVLTPDGRGLRHCDHVLDVIDATTGALFRAHRGHDGVVRALAWSRDGTQLATAADDGRIRLLRPGDPAAIAELVVPRARLDFTPDGRHLCTVTPAEIALWDVTTQAAIRQLAVGDHVNAAELSADGRRVAIASYHRGLRVFDLETGARVVVESEAAAMCSHVTFAGDHVVACGRERVAGPMTLRPSELVHWVHLDERGALQGRGTWRFEDIGYGSVELHVVAGAAMVTTANRLHTYDLRAPAAAARTISIPIGAKLLDARAGRALLRDADDLVCYDLVTGAELERLHGRRPPHLARLSHDGTALAVAYDDQGVEVFAARQGAAVG